MKEDKRIVWAIYAFTLIVFTLVIVLHEMPKGTHTPWFTMYQPLLHAIINGSCFVILIFSLISVKLGNIYLHKLLNTAAMCLSVFFLLSYVSYHYYAPETSYGGEYKTTYYIILLSHILLAAISLPFILLSYYRGITGSIMKHKKLVRITYPMWLYVTGTGVLVYLFLSPYYGK